MRKRVKGVARSRREKEKVSADHTGTDTRASQSTHLQSTAPCTITHLTLGLSAKEESRRERERDWPREFGGFNSKRFKCFQLKLSGRIEVCV